MAATTAKTEPNLDFTTEEALEAMRRGGYDSFRRRKKLGLPLYDWDEENQCVVEIPASQIHVPPPYDKDHPFPLNDD
jgi:hypothetical protein